MVGHKRAIGRSWQTDQGFFSPILKRNGVPILHLELSYRRSKVAGMRGKIK